MSDFIKLAKEILGEAAVLCDEPLSAHSTFKIGGPTDVFLRPETEEELLSLIEAAKRTGTEFFVLGGGSNVLFSDKGFRGAVISTLGLRGVEIDGTRIKAGAGVTLPLLSARAGKNALAVCTISDHLLTGESLPAEQRQTSFTDMMTLALETAVRWETKA